MGGVTEGVYRAYIDGYGKLRPGLENLADSLRHTRVVGQLDLPLLIAW